MANWDDIIRQLLGEQNVSIYDLTTPPFINSGQYSLEQSSETQNGTPMTVDGVDINQQAQTTYTPGLLGETPASTQPSAPMDANSSAENILSSTQAKNQQNTQNMINMGQQAMQQAMQVSQGINQQKQASMNAANQALAQQQQQEAGLGGLLGGLIKQFLIPVKYGGGRK
jgi:hypothetical protein